MPLLSRKPKEVDGVPPENPLEQLVYYDVLVLMDDSGSMEGSLWSQVRDRILSTSQELMICGSLSGKESYEESGRQGGAVRR